MSDLNRMLKLAGREASAQSPTLAPVTTREMKAAPVSAAPVSEAPVTEVVGDAAEAFYDMMDNMAGGEEPAEPFKTIMDEMVRYMSGDQMEDFIADFKRHHGMSDGMDEATGEMSDEDKERSMKNALASADGERGEEKKKVSLKKAPWESVEEAAKPDFADIDDDGDEEESMKKAAADKAKMDEACDCGCGETPCTCEETLEEMEVVSEAPTMDTTQLITMMKLSGISEATIQRKLTEWANSASDAAEVESTSHGEAYEYAQSVNLSLKRYLDAEDMKVKVSEHKVETMKALYESKKSKSK